MTIPIISEYRWLEKLYRISDSYRERFGAPLLNVSHWNASEETRLALLPFLAPPPVDLINYFYSYAVNPGNIISKLGYESPAGKTCLVTPGGTTSMLSAVNLLKAMSVNSLNILCPFYFPLAYHSRLLRLQSRFLSMDRRAGRFYLPSGIPENLASNAALWITNPVYCTSIYICASDLERLKKFLRRGGVVVADESLALKGRELSRALGKEENFIGIYSPPKAVGLNAMKFSALVVHERYENFLDSWADILFGGLAASTISAIHHFLSDEFPYYEREFIRAVDSCLDFLRKLVKKYRSIQLDRGARGQYVTCYVPAVDAKSGDDENFLWNVAEETGSIFINNTRNRFAPQWGLSFRVNLALDSPQFRSSLVRLLDFLSRGQA
jgi:hypothetical protein